MSLEKRIDKLEAVCRPKRQPRPSFVMVSEDGQPINQRYAEVLRLYREAEAKGEDARLALFTVPAGIAPLEDGRR